jgi:hypothetical protein
MPKPNYKWHGQNFWARNLAVFAQNLRLFVEFEIKLSDKKTQMLQHSKIVQSRHDWRRKAVQRADKIRDYRKSQKRQKK